MNCEHTHTTIKIPSGNDFRLHVCVNDVVPGEASPSFTEVDGLNVYLTRLTRRTHVPHVADGTDLFIDVSADKVEFGFYGLELVGTHDGHPWRFRCSPVFQIVPTNCQSSEQAVETFGVETYYLHDVLWVEVVDDIMHFTSEGHAVIANNTLTLEATDKTEVTVEGDTLYITIN